MSTDLCLGTAQFGLKYGVTNTNGQVAREEVREILEVGAREGIKFLDTAQAYGSSESVLGSFHTHSSKYRVVSKLSGNSSPQDWEQLFRCSLKNLKVDYLDSLLLHRSADLRGEHSDRLLEWLLSLRSRGLVKRVGISIYEAADLKDIPLDYLQIVQLPLSLYDQRLITDGTVTHLRNKGIAVHARSMLLQGLLVTPVSRWPSHLSPSFIEHHEKLSLMLKERRVSLLGAALSYAKSIQDLEAVVLGVQSLKELNEILDSWNNLLEIEDDFFSAWAWKNGQDLDPRCWPRN